MIIEAYVPRPIEVQPIIIYNLIHFLYTYYCHEYNWHNNLINQSFIIKIKYVSYAIF